MMKPKNYNSQITTARINISIVTIIFISSTINFKNGTNINNSENNNNR